jgi:3-hydroxyisobutyrate dehydrogenase
MLPRLADYFNLVSKGDVIQVGFIGAGSIGGPIAEQILRSGFSLGVHDIREDPAALLLEQGATWANSPRELAEQCDVVCPYLPEPTEMDTVVLGENGVAAGLKSGWFTLTTLPILPH